MITFWEFGQPCIYYSPHVCRNLSTQKAGQPERYTSTLAELVLWNVEWKNEDQKAQSFITLQKEVHDIKDYKKVV